MWLNYINELDVVQLNSISPDFFPPKFRQKSGLMEFLSVKLFLVY